MNQHGLTDGDPLWVPLLTHYRPDGGIDGPRMTSHLESIAPHLRQIMIAGSTGDGWELGEARFAQVLEWTIQETPGDTRIIFGALAPDTASVLARIRMVEDRIASEPAFRVRYAGVTVCPPVKADASQDEIAAHYHAVLAQTESPLALYQLPQVTGCSIAAETVEKLSTSPRVTMFKDSSGTDTVASSGKDLSGLMMVRGAEGGYVEAVATGKYDGWLLSTANVFGDQLRQMETLVRKARKAEAMKLSDRMSAVVAQLFDAAAQEGGANAFSNANRAADHIAAHGRNWRQSPLPLKQDGHRLSAELARQACGICEALLEIGDHGYFRA